MAQNIFSQLAQQTLSTATTPAGGGAAGDDDPTSAITAVAQEHGVNPNFLLGLAQLETRGGKATVKGQGVDSRNLFNIKDFSKAGTGIRALDKAEGSNDPYRRYDSASDSARDLVRLLGSKRYEGALTAQTPEEFAAALKRGGYATDPDHDKKVIATIRSIEAKGGTPAPAPAQPWDQGARYVPMEHMVPGGPPAHNPNKNPDFLRGAGDVALSFLQGAAGSVKSVTDLAAPTNAVSRGLDDVSKELGKLKSEEAQQSLAYHQKKIRDAETSGDWKQEIAAYGDMVWDMPGDSLAQALGSLITLGAGKTAQALKLALSARKAGMTKEAFLKTAQGVEAAKKASNLGAGVNLGLGVGQGVGGVKGEQYERTYNAAKEEGLADDKAKALATEAQSYGKGWMQQAAGAALGYAAAKTGPLEKLASGQTVGAGGVLRRFAGGAAIESASEGGQGGQARYAGNTAAIDAGVLDESQRFAGVAGTAFSEGLLGGMVGGGAGALGRPDVDPLATTKEAAKKPNSPISRAAVAGQPAKPEQQPAQTPVAAGAGAQSQEADPTFAEMSDSVLLQLQRSLQERQAAGDEDITDDEIELAQAAKAEYERRMAAKPPAVPGSVTPPQPTTPQTNEAPAQPAGVSASEKVQPATAKAQPAITVDLNPAPRAPSPFDAVLMEQDPAITQQQREDAAKAQERHRKHMAALRLGVYNNNPMMEFLGRHGLQPETQNEFAPGTTERRKASVYGYGPVFRQNGKPLDLLLSNAKDEGFLPPEASESDLYDLVARAINGERVEPLYKAGSADALMQRLAAEREAKEAASYEDFLAQQQALAADPDYDPFATFADTENDYDVSDLDNSGYSQAEKSLQAEVSALAQAYSQLGFDADDVLEPLAIQYESNPDEYYAQARQRLTQLIAQATQPRGDGNLPQDSGEQAQAPIGREAANATSADDDALIDYAIEDDGEPDYFLQAQTARQLREREDAIAEQARLNAERQQALEAKAQADDILSDNGKPFAFEYGAKLRAKKDGGEVVQVEGGYVVRPTQSAATQADPLAGNKIDDEWTAFPEQSGTLGIPRAEMPQVKAQDRDAMVNFLKARGIDSSNEVMPARAIKPTQAEFSPAKVQKAAERTENQRSIIVSADGHVVDGHHQWMAQRQKGEPVKVIKLDQPIGQVLEALKGMPSAQPEQVANQPPVQPAIDTSPAAKWRNNWEEAKRTAESLGLSIKNADGRNLRLPQMVPAIEAKLARQQMAAAAPDSTQVKAAESAPQQTDTPLGRAETELADWKERRDLPANAGNVTDVPQGNPTAAMGTEAEPSNPFGPILTQYRYDAQGAIKALTELKSGEAVAALHHPEVGDIDLVWGKAPEGGTNGFGLAKLVKKHPEVLQDLQGFLDRLHKDPKQSGKNRIRLIDNRGTAVVRLQWEGKSKKWLLTAFENNTPGATTRTDIGSLAIKDDTASLEAGSGQSLPTGPQLSNTLAESASEPAFPEQSELNEKREALGEREKELAAESKANEAAQAQSNDVPSTEQQVSGFSRGFERSVQDGLSGDKLPPVATTVPSSSFASRQLGPSTEVSGNSPPRMGTREVGAFLNKLAQADAVGHGRAVEEIPTIDGGEDVKGKQYSAKLAPSPELLSQVRERFQSVEDDFRAATGYGFDALTESEARYLAKHDNAQSVRDRIVEAGRSASVGLDQVGSGSPQGIKASRSRLTTPVTNTGLPTAQVEAVVRQLQSGWNNAPTVVVVQDLQDPRVPQAVRDENARQVAAGAEGAPEGFIHGETVYLVANQMGSPADAARVLLHEVVGHHGLRGVFGDTLSPILRDLANKRRREVVTMAIRQGLKPDSVADNASVADIYQAMTPAQREQAAEEVLAYMAQNQPELGFVRRAIAAIRQWLKSTFPALGERLALTDGDIVANYILPARAFVESGRPRVQAHRTAKAQSNLMDVLAALDESGVVDINC